MALNERFGDNTLTKEENLGSILSPVRVVPIEAIIAFEILLGGINITYSAFQDLYFTDDTGRFRERTRLTRDGAQNTQELQLLIPRDRTELRNWLNENAEGEFILLFTDMNQQRVVMGTDETPARKQEDLDTGGTPRNRNGYAVKFAAQTEEKKYQVLSEVVATATNLIFQDNNNFVWQDGNNAIAQESV